MEFLESVIMVYRTAIHNDSPQGLDVFCHRYQLAENIQVRGHPSALGEGAPVRPALGQGAGLVARGAGSCRVPLRLCSADAAGRGAQGPALHSGAAARHACHRRIEVPARPSCGPLTRGPCPAAQGLEALLPAPVSDWPLSLCSSVEMVLEGKKQSLLRACFASVLCLPAEGEMPGLNIDLHITVSAGRAAGAPSSPGLLPGRPVSPSDQGSEAGQGLGLAFPPTALCPLPVGLPTSSAAGCSARSTLSAPGSLPSTVGLQGW